MYRELRYSSDGSYLYYSRQDFGQKSCALYRLAVLGGVPEKLRDEIAPYFDVARDDNRVAFVMEDRANNTRRLSNLNGANESALVTLTGEQLSTRGAAWSPDSSMIAAGASADSTQPNQSISLLQTTSGKLFAFDRQTEIRDVVLLKDSN